MSVRILFIVKELEGAEPMGALYVAGALQQAGHECRFCGTRGKDVLEEVRRYCPDVVAYSATTGMHEYYLGLNARIKEEHSCLCLLGGPHPTFFPEVIFTPGVDVVCRGEGEGAAVELCDALAEGRDYRNIKDLWVKHEGRIYRNGPRPLLLDLDQLPFPPRELLYAYDDRLRQRPLKSFTTNRGCPFPCSYCFNQSLVEHYGASWRKVRVRSPDNVMAEIARVRRQGPLQILGFRESIFAFSKAWLKEFGELYRQEVNLPFYCHVRADMMDEEMVELLAWAGCVSVNVGIETANSELADRVLNRRMKTADMVEGLRRLKRAGIAIFADNMVGIPGGTLADDLATLKLNIDLDVEFAAATLCTPYPGTQIAKYAEDHGLFDGDYDQIDSSYYTRSALKFSSPLEKRQIENLQKLFALTAAMPALFPLVKQLIKLPPNHFFYAAFRSWYVISHMTEIMPRRPDWTQLKESLLSIFGVYHGKDPNHYPAPGPMPLPWGKIAGEEADPVAPPHSS